MKLRPNRPSRRAQRAIFLITVLFFSLLVTLFIEGAIALSPSGLARSQADAGTSSADQAAKSGIDWVRGRLSSDPTWQATVVQTFSVPGTLLVHEGNGQVEGWVRQGEGWSRFRLRFNYQDGPASIDPNSDNMDDPPAAWTDMPYVSCNNLQGGGLKTAPLASGSLGSSHSGPWGNTQTNVPPASLLLSIEGASGSSKLDSTGLPSGFSGAIHTRTIQTIMRFGNNQPITSAAIMGASSVSVNLYGGPLKLSSTDAQTTRLRSKGTLNVGDVTSPAGELRSTATAIHGTLTNTTATGENSDGFYQIPLDKVRAPQGSMTLTAGTYVVTASGTVMYYDMDYSKFVTYTSTPLGGAPVTLPSGMQLTSQTADASKPKWTLKVTADLKINASGQSSDFAIIPDGGAASSAGYDSLPSTDNKKTSSDTDYWLGVHNRSGQADSNAAPLTTDILNVWKAFAQQNSTSSEVDGNSTKYTLSGGRTLSIPNDTTGKLNLSGGANEDIASLMSLPSNASYKSQLQSITSTAQTSSSTSSSSTALAPSDLELNLVGSGSSGMTLTNNNGSITIGSQIQGHGASVVSKKNIELIGTSTALSSDPQTALGLNLYAQGNVTIDAFKLDSSSGSFHGISMKGIIYSWHDINILAGNSTNSAAFTLDGEMVAYGGNPAASPTASANAVINAQTANITYDPAYVSSIVSTGPFTLEVTSWHEF